MFDMFSNIWKVLQGGVAGADPTAAQKLAQLGDPDAVMKPLFSDTKTWSPTYFEDGLMPKAGGMLDPNSPMVTYDQILNPVPAPAKPQIDLSNSAYNMDGSPRPTIANPEAKPPVLNPEQMKTLMGAMPEGRPGPMPGTPSTFGRPQVGSMAQLQAGAPPAAMRPTLGSLIFGR